MRLLDIINQLRLILPKYSTRFGSNLSITSITASGGTATIITTGAHGLSNGQLVSLSNVETLTPIAAFSKDGLVFTFTTPSDHDLTYGWLEHETITMSGFTDSAWNTSFTLQDVPNRDSFKVQSINSDPVLNGNEVLHEIRSDGVNGAYSVTVVNTATFTISGSFIDGNYSGGTVTKDVRIAGTVNIERAIEQYTEQNIGDLWGFVSMHDAEVSKNRHAVSDATSTPTTGTAIRERIVDGFSLYLVIKTTEDIAAQDAVDICRHELLSPILKSVYGARFTSGLTEDTDFRSILTGHGSVSYNRAIYVHVYTFELSMDITENDAVEPSDTRAYRDTNLTIERGTIDTPDLTVTINQDDEPVI